MARKKVKVPAAAVIPVSAESHRVPGGGGLSCRVTAATTVMVTSAVTPEAASGQASVSDPA